jgi:hypothetical protein
MGKLEDAYGIHLLALSVSGIEIKWYSGTLVNIADNLRRQMKFKEASQFIHSAVVKKIKIGDMDELMVALHNMFRILSCEQLSYYSDPDALLPAAKEINRILVDIIRNSGISADHGVIFEDIKIIESYIQSNGDAAIKKQWADHVFT